MARTSTEITPAEVQAYATFCSERGIIHDGSPDDAANSNLVLNYFTETWPNEISHRTLAQAFPQLKPHLKFKSAAQLEVETVASENQAAIRPLSAWFENQNMIVKDGDDGYRNFALLLTELRGRDVNSKTIYEAMGRISYRPGRQLVNVPTPAKIDPRQHQSDGTPFLGKDVNKSLMDYKREARAAYAEPDESPSSIRGREIAAAKSDAEALRGRTHSETQHIQRVLVTKEGTTDVDWIATRDARRSMQQSFERRSAVTSRGYR